MPLTLTNLPTTVGKVAVWPPSGNPWGPNNPLRTRWTHRPGGLTEGPEQTSGNGRTVTSTISHITYLSTTATIIPPPTSSLELSTVTVSPSLSWPSILGLPPDTPTAPIAASQTSFLPTTLPSSSSSSDITGIPTTLSSTSDLQDTLLSTSHAIYTVPNSTVVSTLITHESSTAIPITSPALSTALTILDSTSATTSSALASVTSQLTTIMAPDPRSTVLATITMTVPDTYDPIPVASDGVSITYTSIDSGSIGSPSTSATLSHQTSSLRTSSPQTPSPKTSWSHISSSSSNSSSSSQTSSTTHASSSSVAVSTSSSTSLSSSTQKQSKSSTSLATSVTSSSNGTTLSTITTSQSFTSSNAVPTQTGTPPLASSSSPPNADPSTNHLAIFLPALIILLVPAIVAVAMFIWRRTFPDHYIRAEQHCPVRRLIRFIKNLPPILALRQRRDRNRGIIERQRRYMTRRTRARMWSRVSSMVGEPNGTVTGFGSVHGVGMERVREQDEWLRRDMLEHYGERDPPVQVESAALRPDGHMGGNVTRRATTPSTVKSGAESSRSAWGRYFASGTPDQPATRHSAMGPQDSNGLHYTPGRLTGDGAADVHSTIDSSRRLREMVKAQREKVLNDKL